jgi:hypothetical protein
MPLLNFSQPTESYRKYSHKFGLSRYVRQFVPIFGNSCRAIMSEPPFTPTRRIFTNLRDVSAVTAAGRRLADTYEC